LIQHRSGLVASTLRSHKFSTRVVWLFITLFVFLRPMDFGTAWITLVYGGEV
jgi:hypothetical protein